MKTRFSPGTRDYATMLSRPNNLSPPLVRLVDRCIVWHVRQGFEACLAQWRTDFFSLPGRANIRPFKSGDRRAVWRIHDERLGAVFAKFFDAAGLPGRFWARIVGAPARREAEALIEAERREIPAVEVLACGVRRIDGANVLVTREAEDASPLPECWGKVSYSAPGSDMRRHRVALLTSAAALLADAHGKGLVHLDGHPGNILVTRNDSPNPVACYVDLARCAWYRGLTPPRRRIEAIAQLYQFAVGKTTRTDRIRFLHRYLAGGWPGGSIDGSPRRRSRRLIQSIELSRMRHAKRLARHRDRRLQRDGKYFHSISLAGGWWGVVATRLERRHRFREASVVDRTIQMWRNELESAPAAAARDAGQDGRTRVGTLRVNLTNARGLAQALLWTIGRSPARRCFERCHRNRHRDEPAPLVLGYLEQTRGGLIRKSLTIEDDGASKRALRDEDD